MKPLVPYEITLDIDPPFVAEVDARLLEQVAHTVLAGEGVPGPADVGVWITNADELQTLNRTYRDVDSTTDVLSFGDDPDDAPAWSIPGEPQHLGDVAISWQHVTAQAAEYGHSRDRELAYLLAHGLLHLLGYDHETPDEAAAMRSREEQYLGGLGIVRTTNDA